MTPPGRRAGALATALLGLALAVNSLLGPLGAGVIRYRFSETLVLQGIGLDLVSLAVVAPLCLAAGFLSLRRHPAGLVLALGPSLYAVYMSVQYVVGPEYLRLPGNNERFFLLHLGIFVTGSALAVRSWRHMDPSTLPPSTAGGRRLWGGVLLLLAALLVLRYVPALAALTGGDPGMAEYRENPTSFVLITFMDLGVFTPAAFAAGRSLRGGRGTGGWDLKTLHGLIGWFALVGLAVAAMATTSWTAGDPSASRESAAAFVAVGVVLTGLAIRLYRRLFGGSVDG